MVNVIGIFYLSNVACTFPVYGLGFGIDDDNLFLLVEEKKAERAKPFFAHIYNITHT